MIFTSLNKKSVEILKKGGIGIIPTDTIYGIVASALNKKSVQRIYRLKKRNPRKPFIILISSPRDLITFSIEPKKSALSSSEKKWPPRTSIIFPCESPRLRYLHRGTNSLAFRIPKNKKLKSFLRKTGPLVAPSANLEGSPPARTVKEAEKYFGEKIDFYLDVGKILGKPSKIFKITGSDKKIIRR